MARSSVVALALVTGAVVLPGCDGEFVSLGASGAPLGEAGRSGGPAITSVWGIAAAPLLAQEEDLLLANPSLTQEGELYFSAQERGSTSAGDPKPTGVRRALPAANGFFAAPVALPLGELTEVDVASPAVSLSGSELWLGMNVGGNTDVFRCALRDGACGTPQRVAELSSGYDDAPRPPALGDTVMALSSKRHGGRHHQIYLAARASADAAWGAPSQAGLEAVNSAEFQSADGFLAEDGLALYFSSTRGGNADLYVSRREDPSQPFGAPRALADLNSAAEERMPWLSPDGQQLYFVSNRPTEQFTQYALYVAQRL
jgi:WD40-like Beta Propeller Repeat